MDFRPDISFEYDYIRIVYEVILSNLRTNKKVIEKDLNTIVTRIQNLKKKQSGASEIQTSIKNLLQKIEDLENKVFTLILLINHYNQYSMKNYATKKNCSTIASKKESTNFE